MRQTAQETVLVTGGSGFQAGYCILKLLSEGYKVKTTIRSLHKADHIREALRHAGASALENLSFHAADLTLDEGWEEATAGCDYVLHVASPFPAAQPKDENELIIPAREGTLRVLRAALQAGVKRVVMTSSFAAIGYSIDPANHVFTEEDWTDPSTAIPPYIKSKTLAERAAWDFIAQADGRMELTVINPVGIFGPVLSNDFTSSVEMIRQVLHGKLPVGPAQSFGVVDARDVADLHVIAMKHPAAKGERFIATSDGTLTFAEIGKMLYTNHQQLLMHTRKDANTDWVDTLFAALKENTQQTEGKPIQGKVISNNKARTMLDWRPRWKETVIMDTAESLLNFNLI